MRKHLFGLAIFISVVAAAVFVYGLFNTPPIPAIPAVDYPIEQREPVIAEEFDTSLISYRVYASEFHVGTGQFQTRVDFEWKGMNDPPKSFFMNFYIIDANKGHQTSVSKSFTVDELFLDGTRQSIIVEAHVSPSLFNRNGNVYTYIEFSADRQFSSKPEERLELADLTSVVMVHPNNRSGLKSRDVGELQ